MTFYANNRKRARTVTKTPTLTDQSQARETDINIIVGRFLKTGTAPGAPKQPVEGVDWTQYPTDLRGFIETSRDYLRHKNALPEQLRNIPVEKLVYMTPDELTTILTPPAPKPAEGETK